MIKKGVGVMLFGTEWRNRLHYIPLDYIISGKIPSRTYFDPKELRVLSESIIRNGVLQPIIVRKLSSEEYEIVSGERRFRASLMAGLDEIPCIVLKCTENQSVIFSLLENLQHERLNMLEEANVMKFLITECRMSKLQIARRLGKNASVVSDRLALLDFSEEEQQLIIKHNISESHVRAVLFLDRELRKDILSQVADYSLTISQTEQLIDKILKSHDKKQHKNQSERFIIKDVRIFLNTFTKALEVMKSSGIDAQSIQSESDEYIEYCVRIPKESFYSQKK